MSYETVVKQTKKIESALIEIGATGKGLYEKSLSVESKLDKKTLNSIRFIATIRNKLLHEDGFELSTQLSDNFTKECESVYDNLNIPTSSELSCNPNFNNENITTTSQKAICDICSELFDINPDEVYRFKHYNIKLPNECVSCKEKDFAYTDTLIAEKISVKEKSFTKNQKILFTFTLFLVIMILWNPK